MSVRPSTKPVTIASLAVYSTAGAMEASAAARAAACSRARVTPYTGRSEPTRTK